MSSPMMTRMLGLPDGAASWAYAAVVTPPFNITDAASSELPLNNRSRRFNPACAPPSSDFPSFWFLLMTCLSVLDECAMPAGDQSHWSPRQRGCAMSSDRARRWHHGCCSPWGLRHVPLAAPMARLH